MKSFVVPALVFLSLSNAAADRNSRSSRPGLISPGGAFNLYYDSQGPLNFDTLTFKSLPPGAVSIGEVKGKSCQYGLSIPLGIPYTSRSSTSISGSRGDSSFRKIAGNLRKEYPGLEGIYDVKMDRHTVRVLTLFTRFCIEVTAQGFAYR